MVGNTVLTNLNEELVITKKLGVVNEIRSYFSEKEFRYILASILTQAYVALTTLEGIRVTRGKILNKVNNILVSNGCKTVSYQFIRKYY